MWNLKEFNPQINKLSDLLPWAAMIAPGVILNKDGSFQRSFQIRGKDLDSSTRAELITISAQLNNVLRRLGSGWVLYSEAQRIPSIEYPDSDFPDVASYLIDCERKYFFQFGQHYESIYYLTLVYLPPAETQNKFENLFIQNEEKIKDRQSDLYEVHLKNFITETDRIYLLLAELIPECRSLTDDETLTYLHSTVSTKRHKVTTPPVPMYLDAYIPDSPLVGGLAPKLGNCYIGVVSILSFPGYTTPGILDALNQLNFEYRWITRFICLDKLDATKELKNYRRQWFAKRKSIVQMLKEQITRSESALVDNDALNKADDADISIQELANDMVSYGYYTASIIVLNKDPEVLETQLRSVEKAINGKGFTSFTENLNSVDAWLGSLPGMCRSNVRRPIINTMNLAHLFPLSAIWAGPEKNNHLKGPVLMYTQTKGSTPFRLSLHQGDVGHTMVVGPTGAGKSVLLSLIAAQFRRYKNSQVYIFDKGASSRAITAGVGGEFYDLAAEEVGSLSFQPLSRIDEDNQKIWANEWILQYFYDQNIKITPEVKKQVWEALGKVATSPKEERTMFGFQYALQDKYLRQAITDMTVNGAYGKLFDNDSDSLQYGRWQAFEMEQLMNKKGAVMPTLSYLFHRIEENCNGTPTVIILDECWVFLDNPFFADKIREWLKVMRKLNVSVIFATQNLQDIADSKIAPAIMESCPTKIFLPNPNALDERLKGLYYSFGLNDKERKIIAVATPKKHYYYKSVQGSRLFDLRMGPCALSYCAASSKEDQNMIQHLLGEYGKQNFNKAWLQYKGQNEALEFLAQNPLSDFESLNNVEEDDFDVKISDHDVIKEMIKIDSFKLENNVIDKKVAFNVASKQIIQKPSLRQNSPTKPPSTSNYPENGKILNLREIKQTLQDEKHLSTNLVLEDNSSKAKITILFSVKDGIGKSTITTNLASLVAQGGRQKVLIIDLGVMSFDSTITVQRNLHSLLYHIDKGFDKNSKLFNPAQLKNMILETSIPRLSMICGVAVPEELRHIKLEHIKALLALLNNQYDQIIIRVSSSVTYFKDLLSIADTNLAVTQCEIINIRNTRNLLVKLQQDSKEIINNIRLVINEITNNSDFGEIEARSAFSNFSPQLIVGCIPKDVSSILLSREKRRPAIFISPISEFAKEITKIGVNLTLLENQLKQDLPTAVPEQKQSNFIKKFLKR